MKKNHRVCYRLNSELREYRDRLFRIVLKKTNYKVRPSVIARVFFYVLKEDKSLSKKFCEKIINHIKNHDGSTLLLFLLTCVRVCGIL